MHRTTSILTLAAVAGFAHAEVTFQFIGDGVSAASVSNGGTVVVGNTIADENYETFRWTEGTGVVNLGRPTVPYLGTGAGVPAVSFDGTRISATIISKDFTTGVPAIWEDGTWNECLPMAPNGWILDDYYGSAWSISGDGSKLCGLHWVAGGVSGGGAHAMTANESSGIEDIDLASSFSSRANGISEDGSVVAGWRTIPGGLWQPTAWVNGVQHELVDSGLYFTEAFAVSGDGQVVVGEDFDDATNTVTATRWVYDGADWTRHYIGLLPGTGFEIGRSYALSANNDGSIVVGTNNFVDNGPFSLGTAFIWTPELGMMDGLDWFDMVGIDFDDETYELLAFNDVSNEGDAIVGLVRYTGTLNYRAFLIRILPDCPWDLDGDGAVGSGDLALIVGFWGQTEVPGDFNGDGVGSDDLAALIGNWGPCP